MVDPRRTETAAQATLHVAVRPGQDWAFLLGVLKVVFDHGWDRTATAVPVAVWESSGSSLERRTSPTSQPAATSPST